MHSNGLCNSIQPVNRLHENTYHILHSPSSHLVVVEDCFQRVWSMTSVGFPSYFLDKKWISMKIRAQISSQNNWPQTWHFISSVHKHHKHPNKKKPPPSPTGRIRQLRQPPRVLFLDSARTPQNVLWSVPIASGPMDQRPSRCFFFRSKKSCRLVLCRFFPATFMQRIQTHCQFTWGNCRKGYQISC